MASNITNLSPFTQYWVAVFAQTVESGESSNIYLMTHEDSKLILIEHYSDY